MMGVLLFVPLIIIAYLCGSVCSAIIVSKVFSLPDPRSEGSLNPGATNVLRLAGKKYASLVLIADMLKGFIPVFLGQLLQANYTTLGFICFAAVLGHIYPFFFKYKGGKGVATALGCFFGLNLILGVVVLAIWLLVANFTRYSSLASILSMICAPFLAIISTGNANAFPPLALMVGFIIYKHRDNINRLIDGEESKLVLHKHQLSELAQEIIEEREANMSNTASNDKHAGQAVAPKPKVHRTSSKDKVKRVKQSDENA